MCRNEDGKRGGSNAEATIASGGSARIDRSRRLASPEGRREPGRGRIFGAAAAGAAPLAATLDTYRGLFRLSAQIKALDRARPMVGVQAALLQRRLQRFLVQHSDRRFLAVPAGGGAGDPSSSLTYPGDGPGAGP